MTRGKAVLLGSAVVLALLLAFSCSLPPGDDAGTADDGLCLKLQWFIKLQIKAPGGPKAITVSDYRVTGLRISLLDPQGELLRKIYWTTREGSQTYLIPVKRRGEYKIEVVHVGQRSGEVVEASESIAFSIRAMGITVVGIVPGCIGVICIEDEASL